MAVVNYFSHSIIPVSYENYIGNSIVPISYMYSRTV